LGVRYRIWLLFTNIFLPLGPSCSCTSRVSIRPLRPAAPCSVRVRRVRAGNDPGTGQGGHGARGGAGHQIGPPDWPSVPSCRHAPRYLHCVQLPRGAPLLSLASPPPPLAIPPPCWTGHPLRADSFQYRRNIESLKTYWYWDTTTKRAKKSPHRRSFSCTNGLSAQ